MSVRFAMALLAASLISAPVFADDAGDAVKGEKVFNKCKACHSVGEGAKNKVGPELNGIVGRAAASVEGYKYSDGLSAKAAAGLVWDEDAMFAYLENPGAFVEGKSKMTFNLKKDDDRRNVIAYLKQFDATGGKM